MTQVTIHIHRDTAGPLIEAGSDGARHLAAAVRRALAVLQSDGRRIAYAPVALGDGRGCAMSVRPNGSGVVIEIDAPGTILPGRGVVRDDGFRPFRR